MIQIIDLNNENDITEFEDFVSSHPNGGFMQSIKWSRVKKNWLCEAVAVKDNDGNIKGTALILIKRLPLFRHSFFYCPHGPVCDYDDAETFRELISAIDNLAVKYKAVQLKIDPCISEDTPMSRSLLSFGFTHKNNANEYSSIQSRNNYMLFFKGRSKDELFSSFHSKWRYNIRLAQRHDVICRVCGIEALDDFYSLMEETGHRDGFCIRGKKYFGNMLEGLGESCHLYMCYCNGVPLSGAVCVRYAGKSCYVYGASTEKMRNVMPNYLMQWTMICDAVDNGCTVHDFQGIPYYYDKNHPNYGVYRFKKGFNGEIVTFAGDFSRTYNRLFSSVCEAALAVHKRIRSAYTFLFVRRRTKK